MGTNVANVCEIQTFGNRMLQGNKSPGNLKSNVWAKYSILGIRTINRHIETI